MNGPQHWEEADKILTVDDRCSDGCPHTGCEHEMAMIARAQVHALLANAAVSAQLLLGDAASEWAEAIDPDYAAGQAAEVTR